jgi:hypothetical protein
VRSGEAANAADPEAAMVQVAPDLVLRYPGLPDMGHDAPAEGYRRMLRTPRVTARRMKDLQIWRRSTDGQWRFARGMHLPMPADSTGGTLPP